MSDRGDQLRKLVRSGARRVGLESEAIQLHEAWLSLRAGPKQRRNEREHERVRLLSAAALREDSNCIDVGANQGQLLEVFSGLAPRGRHIAYEPVPWLSEALARRFPQVDVRGRAVSDHRGTASFAVHRRLPSRSGLRAAGFSAEQVDTIQVEVEDLDSSLPGGYIPHLIKIDVEGAEHLVLRGARETLRAHRPMILFEHQRVTAMHYGSGPDDVFDLLVDDLGMRIFDMDGRGPYTRDELSDTYESGRRWNFFAADASLGLGDEVSPTATEARAT